MKIFKRFSKNKVIDLIHIFKEDPVAGEDGDVFPRLAVADPPAEATQQIDTEALLQDLEDIHLLDVVGIEVTMFLSIYL